MTIDKYLFNISVDIPSGLNQLKLENQIIKSDIVPAIKKISKNTNDTLDIWFKGPLASGEKDILFGNVYGPCQGIVASHINALKPDDTQIVEVKGPKNTDGKNIFTLNPFPDDIYLYYTAACDNIPSGTRGDGPEFIVNSTGIAEYVSYVQFIDNVYFYGGEALIVGDTHINDYVISELVAPATSVTVASGSDGNANLVSVVSGVLNIIVPATGDGGYNVNISEALYPTLASKSNGTPTTVTKAVPVTAEKSDGYWDFDINTGDISANYNGIGKYNLFDAEVIMARWINKHRIKTSPVTKIRIIEYHVPTKSSLIIPHYKMKVTTNAAGTGLFDIAWTLFTARSHSV